jgi:hypothetical protein
MALFQSHLDEEMVALESVLSFFQERVARIVLSQKKSDAYTGLPPNDQELKPNLPTVYRLL